MTIWIALVLAAPLGGDLDSDGDGLSDFDEHHKYRTDPALEDSDGDGVADGDWHERREFTYTVRAVVQVLRPVTPEYLEGDFQDARVLDERGDVVELEVLLYPYATAASELRGDPEWRDTVSTPELERWLAPGPTSDWDEELADALKAALAADGIDVQVLDDRALVEQASAWLLRHAEYVDSFTTFSTAFDADGRPFVPEELVPHVGDGSPPTAEQWERELSARGMFEHATRGSCSSSAIYLSGCLRALGIPTRTVLCIPIIDAGDEREWALVRGGIELASARRTMLAGLAGLERSWASHTFNEVFVGGRWWRLDYDELGVGVLRSDRFGLIVHVATFQDWADARMPETIGRRQALNRRDAVLDGANPYSTISLRDEVGPYSTLELPAAEALTARIEELVWTDDRDLPDDVRRGIERADRFGLLARVTGVADFVALTELMAVADLRIYLEAEGHPTLSVALDAGCMWGRGDHALVYVPFGPADRNGLAEGVAYRPRARNGNAEARLEIGVDVRALRED